MQAIRWPGIEAAETMPIECFRICLEIFSRRLRSAALFPRDLALRAFCIGFGFRERPSIEMKFEKE
jgi:hypothetical protein